ncbi:RNA 3'-terminal phosphate cyclase [Candidatus Woesearchaeota archaeon]|nr:RNA 3'-terminal phosphate cyclase [Candidatus Woesearchaeota archaeon]
MKEETEFVRLDGCFAEGGGQIVRSALGLSALLGIPFDIHSIRHGRCTSGLKAQHVTAITALQELTKATVIGGKAGSETLSFKPGQFVPKDLKIDVGTAGSITLVIQALILPMIFAKKRMNVKITGGTDVEWSMPIDYLKEVLIPQLRRYAHIECNIHRRGYYPKGNGLVEMDVRPRFDLSTMRSAPSIQLVKANPLVMVRGVAHASHDLAQAKVAERMAQAAAKALKDLNVPIDIRQEYHTAASTGCGIALFAYRGVGGEFDVEDPQILGADALGRMGVPAEDVGAKAARLLKTQIGADAPVDEFLADNLVPFIALCGGVLKTTKISEHTKANAYVVESFLGKCLDVDGESRIIRGSLNVFTRELPI